MKPIRNVRALLSLRVKAATIKSRNKVSTLRKGNFITVVFTKSGRIRTRGKLFFYVALEYDGETLNIGDEPRIEK